MTFDTTKPKQQSRPSINCTFPTVMSMKCVKISLMKSRGLTAIRVKFTVTEWTPRMQLYEQCISFYTWAISWCERRWSVSSGPRWWKWTVRWTWTELWGWSGGPPQEWAGKRLADQRHETRRVAGHLSSCCHPCPECHWVSCRSPQGGKRVVTNLSDHNGITQMVGPKHSIKSTTSMFYP